MKTVNVKLTLLSDALIASGEGSGAIIDSDILFDDVGLPFIPGRRFKGCLREAAREVQVMLNQSGLKTLSEQFFLEEVFGTPGLAEVPQVSFSGLHPEQYEENKAWLTYLNLRSEDVLDTLASLRYQIAIEDQDSKYQGVTKDHSLRTIRVLNQGFCFKGQITLNHESDFERLLPTLLLACQQLEDVGIGAKRKRGLGHVTCELWDGQVNLSQIRLAEVLSHA